MAEARDPEEIDIPLVVSATLRGMMHGEQSVKEASRAASAHRHHARYPQRYLVRGMRAELNFEADLRKTVRFLWFKKTEVRPSTTVKIRIALESSLDQPLPLAVSSALLMTVPRFLDHGGDSEALDLNLLDGRALRMDFLPVVEERFLETIMFAVNGSPAGGVTRQAALLDDGTRDMAQPAEWSVPTEWPMDIMVPLLDTIAEWRLGRMSSRNVSCSQRLLKRDEPGKQQAGLDALDEVLEKILDGCKEVSKDLERVSTETPSEGGMQLSVLSATVRVHLDSHGSVARSRERPESSQQLDLAVTPGATTHDRSTLITFDLPDFLVEGGLRDEILDRLRTQEEQGRIWRAWRSRLASEDATLSAEQIAALLEASKQPGCGIVIRVGHGHRRNDADTDLVLLQDETGRDQTGLLLEVTFRRSRNGGQPSIDEIGKIEVVAHRLSGTWQGSRHRSLQSPHYFARLLRTLHTLQKFVAAGL